MMMKNDRNGGNFGEVPLQVLVLRGNEEVRLVPVPDFALDGLRRRLGLVVAALVPLKPPGALERRPVLPTHALKLVKRVPRCECPHIAHEQLGQGRLDVPVPARHDRVDKVAVHEHLVGLPEPEVHVEEPQGLPHGLVALDSHAAPVPPAPRRTAAHSAAFPQGKSSSVGWLGSGSSVGGSRPV